MNFETLLYEVVGHAAYVTLNRPSQGNALNETMHRELLEAWQRINQDDSVWGVVIQGAGADFCIGEDAHEIAEAYRKGGMVSRWAQDEAWLRKHTRPPIFGWPQPQDARPTKPIVTVVHGRCQGSGLMFIANNAITLASEDAEFSLPNVHQGTAPMHELLVLSRTMARTPVLGLALLGKHEKWTAERAWELGLVLEMLPKEKLRQRAEEIVDILLMQNAPLAVQSGFLEWWLSFDTPQGPKRDIAMTYAAENTLTTLDFKEGPRAFAEKRKPRWNAG